MIKTFVTKKQNKQTKKLNALKSIYVQNDYVIVSNNVCFEIYIILYDFS